MTTFDLEKYQFVLNTLKGELQNTLYEWLAEDYPNVLDEFITFQYKEIVEEGDED